MKLNFSVKELYGGAFLVSCTSVYNGEHIELTSTCSCDKMRLQTVISKCRNTIYSRFYAAFKKGIKVPHPSTVKFEWDNDTTNLSGFFKRVHEKETFTHELTAEKTSVEKSEIPLLEVAKKGTVWTVIKHKEPLMTWDEACKCLKQKVDGNEVR